MKRGRMAVKSVIVICVFSVLLVASLTFFAAYMHPSKSITVHINDYGEADFELPIFIIAMIGGCYFVWAEGERWVME